MLLGDWTSAESYAPTSEQLARLYIVATLFVDHFTSSKHRCGGAAALPVAAVVCLVALWSSSIFLGPLLVWQVIVIYFCKSAVLKAFPWLYLQGGDNKFALPPDSAAHFWGALSGCAVGLTFCFFVNHDSCVSLAGLLSLFAIALSEFFVPLVSAQMRASGGG